MTSSLHIVVYYGDHRDNRSGYTLIDGKLSRTSEYFNDQPKRQWTVIITLYQFLTSCHGPSDLTSWRIQQGMTSLQVKVISHQQDPNWPHSLCGLFSQVVLNEAHLICNLDLMQANTVAFLEMPFYLCLTVMPLFNFYLDFQGFLRLLIPVSNDKM